jgi:hypothetical protein
VHLAFLRTWRFCALGICARCPPEKLAGEHDGQCSPVAEFGSLFLLGFFASRKRFCIASSEQSENKEGKRITNMRHG